MKTTRGHRVKDQRKRSGCVLSTCSPRTCRDDFRACQNGADGLEVSWGFPSGHVRLTLYVDCRTGGSFIDYILHKSMRSVFRCNESFKRILVTWSRVRFILELNPFLGLSEWLSGAEIPPSRKGLSNGITGGQPPVIELPLSKTRFLFWRSSWSV